MSTQEQVYDEDEFFDEDFEPVGWPALGWIILSAMTAVVAFLLAPLP